MAESTIIISSSDLVEHAVLTRKRNETLFRREFLLRNGASQSDAHIRALDMLLSEIEEKLEPLDKKLKQVDLITVVPYRSEIISITEQVNQHSRAELDSAMKEKTGPVYELLKKRAAYTKNNFMKRDEISRLNIIANMLPRECGMALKTLVESGAMDEIDVSTLAPQVQQELVNLLGRIGKTAFVYNGKLSLDPNKVDGLTYLSWPVEARKTLDTGQVVWIPKDKEKVWDENEERFRKLANKILARTHEKQVRKLSPEELQEFEQMQKEYLEAKEVRRNLMSSISPLKVALPKQGEPKKERYEMPSIDL